MVRVECHRCGGKGEIKAFKHVAGGVCFACGGRGFKMMKAAPVRGKKFGITAVERETGNRILVFWVTAKTEAAAVKKAAATLARANGFIAATAEIAA